jgi:hypothetical protein
MGRNSEGSEASRSDGTSGGRGSGKEDDVDGRQEADRGGTKSEMGETESGAEEGGIRFIEACRILAAGFLAHLDEY